MKREAFPVLSHHIYRQQLSALAFAVLLFLPLLPALGWAYPLVPIAISIGIIGLLALPAGKIQITAPIWSILLYCGFLVIHHLWIHPQQANLDNVLNLLLGQATLLLFLNQGKGFPFRLLYLAAQLALFGLLAYVLPIYFQNYGLFDLPTIQFGAIGGTSEIAQITSLLLLLLLMLRKLKGDQFRSDYLILGLGIALLLLLKSRTGVLAISAFFLITYFRIFLQYRLLLFGLLIFPALYFLKPASVNGRAQLWAFALNHMDQNVILGVGAGNFGGFFHQAILDDVQRARYSEVQILKIGEVNHLAFNDFVQVFCEQGILGFTLLFLPLFLLIYKNWANKAPPTIPATVVGTAILIFFLFPFHAASSTFLIFLIWGIGFHHLSQGSQKRSFSVAFALPFLFLLTGLVFQDFQLNEKWGRANLILPAPGRSDSKAEALYADLHSQLRFQPAFLYEYGKLQINAGRADKAIPLFLAATQLQPSYDCILSLADAFEVQGNFPKAKEYYLSATYLRPYTLYPKYRYFLLELQAGHLSRACSLGHKVLNMEIRGNQELGIRIQNDVQQYLARHCTVPNQ